MVKTNNFFFIFSFFLFLVLNFVSSTISLDGQLEDLASNAEQNLAKIDQVATDPAKTAEDIRKGYLTKEWFGENGLINKYPVLREIHQFLLFASPVLLIFTGESYTPSWAFLFILVFWIWMVGTIYSFIKNGFSVNGWIPLLLSLLFSTIFAQIGLYRVIVVSIGAILFREDTWIYRAITFVVMVLLYGVINYLSRATSEMLKKHKEDVKKKSAEFTEKKMGAFMKGIEDFSKIKD